MKKTIIIVATVLGLLFLGRIMGGKSTAGDQKTLLEYSVEKKWPTVEQFNAAEKLRKAEREKGIFRLRGSIISKRGADLLVAVARGYTDYESTNVVIRDIPIADKVVDGDPIYVTATLNGQAEYTSAIGALVTVRCFRYAGPPEMPTKAGPNDHYIQ